MPGIKINTSPIALRPCGRASTAKKRGRHVLEKAVVQLARLLCDGVLAADRYDTDEALIGLFVAPPAVLGTTSEISELVF